MFIGVLIFIRRSNDPMALLVSLFLVVFGLATFDSLALDALVTQNASLALPVGLVKFAGEVLVMGFFLLFPSGRKACLAVAKTAGRRPRTNRGGSRWPGVRKRLCAGRNADNCSVLSLMIYQ